MLWIRLQRKRTYVLGVLKFRVKSGFRLSGVVIVSNLTLLVHKIKEYQLRYETETYNPKLNGLLNESLIFLDFVGKQLNEIKTLLKEAKV